MTSLPSNIILTRARASDIPAIDELSKLGFRADTHTQMKNVVNGVKEGDQTLDGGTAAYLRSLQENPRVDVIVARDKSSPSGEEAVGVATWGRRNYEKPVSEMRGELPVWGPVPSQPPLPGQRPMTVTDLEGLTDRSIAEWQAYFCRDNVRCRFLIGLTVHPAHQGKGIGKALMRWGTDRCDEEGVYCWVQSSMGGKGAYESAGFQQVGKLELDLDLFAGGTLRDDGGKWGIYVWPYMRRDPVISRID